MKLKLYTTTFPAQSWRPGYETHEQPPTLGSDLGTSVVMFLHFLTWGLRNIGVSYPSAWIGAFKNAQSEFLEET